MMTLDAACIEAKGACHTTSIGDANHNCRAGTGTTERIPPTRVLKALKVLPSIK